MLEEWTIDSLFVSRERVIEALLLVLRQQVSVTNVYHSYDRFVADQYPHASQYCYTVQKSLVVVSDLSYVWLNLIFLNSRGRELVRMIRYFSPIGDDLRSLVFLSATKDLLRSSFDGGFLVERV